MISRILGATLSRAHKAFMALTGKGSILADKPNAFATVQSAIDGLIKSATDRRDMRTVGQLQAARNVIVRESLRAAR